MGNNYCPIIHNKIPYKITWNLQSVNIHDLILGLGYQKITVNECASRGITSVHTITITCFYCYHFHNENNN